METETELRQTHDQLEHRLTELTFEFSKLNFLLKAEGNERQRAEEQMRSHAALLDMTMDAIVVCNPEGRIGYWNEGATHMYGWPAESAKGKLISEIIYPPDSSNFATILTTLAQKQKYQAEELHLNKAGRTLIVDTRWVLVHHPGGQDEILVASTNVTEQKELERQYLRMQRLETLGLLASGIAHDLNNVLAPVLMASQNLINEIKDETQLELLRSIEVSARRGGALVHQILSFARGAEGERAPLQVKQLLHEFQKVAKDTFPRTIQIVTRFGKNIRSVMGNRTQLYQAIMNLCVNARDAMPNGGILQLEASNVVLDAQFVSRYPPAVPGEYLMLKISDNGIGIPEEQLDKIFDPFFTTKETGKGTGLGLSTVLGIVKRHRGFLDVTSKAGKGTKFTLYLPTVESIASTGIDDLSPVLPDGNGKVILVVDDERVIRDITASTLKKNGYQILTAADGTEGFALFTQHRNEISAVITDMSMPLMDGGKMIRALLQIDPKVKIVAISGLNEDFNLPDILKKRIPFLKKPFAVEKLLETLHDLFLAAPAKTPATQSEGKRKLLGGIVS
jgi:two-component system cell cycle sensor histidine kinase/response regulator CckA